MRGQPKTRTVTLGVCALARETGLPRSTVSKRMRAGATPNEIRVYAALRQDRLPPTPSAPHPQRPGAESAGTQNQHEAVLQGREWVEELNNARLRRLLALAEAQELENEALRKQLVPVVYVREWVARYLDFNRKELLRWPDELADVLAAESDPKRCEAIMRGWAERVN